MKDKKKKRKVKPEVAAELDRDMLTASTHGDDVLNQPLKSPYSKDQEEVLMGNGADKQKHTGT